MSVPADSAKTEPFLSTLPPWTTTLTGLILLALMVLAIFTWQQSITRKNLQKNSSGRSRMVAGIIEQNISNSHASKETVDTLVSAFLLEKAKFVEYLDNIDRLTVQELEALAVETGLLGISIAREDGTTVSGPQFWLDPTPCIGPFNTVIYNLERKSGILRYLGDNTLGLCISIGLDAQQILALQNKTALPVLLANLSNLPGIHYVRLEESSVNKKIEGKVVLIPRSGTITAESKIKTQNGTLVVGLDATNFLQRRDQLRKQFIVFAVLLFTLALLFSWILFKRQQTELERTRNFERMLASERETAALGRATATIAHEIRNPLNAINIGLQRLVLESDNLRDEQDQLIEAMREAVTRTSNIIGELQRFTANLIPKQNVVDVANLIRQQLVLYTPIYEQQRVELQVDLANIDTIYGDRDLLAELLENILKNSVEALESGGILQIALNADQKNVTLKIINNGFLLNEEDAKRIGEPYFTTKTRGSGLGLALCRRIAEAHKWNLFIHPDEQTKTFTVTLTIPLSTS